MATYVIYYTQNSTSATRELEFLDLKEFADTLSSFLNNTDLSGVGFLIRN